MQVGIDYLSRGVLQSAPHRHPLRESKAWRHTHKDDSFPFHPLQVRGSRYQRVYDAAKEISSEPLPHNVRPEVVLVQDDLDTMT